MNDTTTDDEPTEPADSYSRWFNMRGRGEVLPRLTQAVLLYLVAGVLFLSGPFMHTQAEEFPQPFLVYGWWLTELFTWPSWLPAIGVAYYVAGALLLYAAGIVLIWLLARFRETLADVSSRRTFLGFLVLAATVGTGIGLAANPAAMQDHALCQDLPETADAISFEGVYKRPAAEQAHVYFAGGHEQVWFYDSGFDGWYVTDFESGYGRRGYAFEATVEFENGPAYVIANDTSLTLYSKNETAIGTQGASPAEQYEFVARCRGETDV